MTEHKSWSPAHRRLQRLAGIAARREGWRSVGPKFVHPDRGAYLKREMDGWLDLCENEAIELEAKP